MRITLYALAALLLGAALGLLAGTTPVYARADPQRPAESPEPGRPALFSDLEDAPGELPDDPGGDGRHHPLAAALPVAGGLGAVMVGVGGGVILASRRPVRR